MECKSFLLVAKVARPPLRATHSHTRLGTGGIRLSEGPERKGRRLRAPGDTAPLPPHPPRKTAGRRHGPPWDGAGPQPQTRLGSKVTKPPPSPGQPKGAALPRGTHTGRANGHKVGVPRSFALTAPLPEE